MTRKMLWRKAINTCLVLIMSTLLLGPFAAYAADSSTGVPASSEKPVVTGGGSIFYDEFAYLSVLGYTEGDWDARLGGFMAWDPLGQHGHGNNFDVPLEATIALGSGDSMAAEGIVSGRYNFNVGGNDGFWNKLSFGVGGEITDNSHTDGSEGHVILQGSYAMYGLESMQLPDGNVTQGGLPIFAGVKFRLILDDRNQVIGEVGTQGIDLHLYFKAENIAWNEGGRNYLDLDSQAGLHHFLDSRWTVWGGFLYREYKEDSDTFAGVIRRPGPQVGVNYPISLGAAVLDLQVRGALFFRTDEWLDEQLVKQSEDKMEGMFQLVLVLHG